MTDVELSVPKNSAAYEQIDGSAPSKRQRCTVFAGGLLCVTIVIGVSLLIASGNGAAAGAAAGAFQGTSSQAAGTCSLTSGKISIKSSGGNREFELYVPKTAPEQATLSLVWHGIASSPSDIEKKMAFKPAAERDGFILAYPIGVGFPKCFNGAGCCARTALGTPKDDVQFGRDIITYLETAGCINPHNVFATGFSNGGFMSHRMGCQAGLRDDGHPWIKAIAPHSGLMGLPGDQDSQCSPGRPVPVLSFQADDDPTVGIDGKGVLGSGPWRSFVDTMGVWVKNNNCGEPVTTQSSSSTVCVDYASCHVKYCTVSGGLKHNWSGAPAERQSRPDDLDATTMIHEFFQVHIV